MREGLGVRTYFSDLSPWLMIAIGFVFFAAISASCRYGLGGVASPERRAQVEEHAGKLLSVFGATFAFLVGFGGGAFYPMFASLTPDYFGENNNASNYGLVYSSKLVGSIVGIGVGASVIDAWGYTGAYWIAAASAVVSAGIATFLRRPGRREASASEPSAPAGDRSLAPTLAD